ncbi:serine-rich and transmembrane domain-containing protein 1 isoform X2 [Macaca mulatta]
MRPCPTQLSHSWVCDDAPRVVVLGGGCDELIKDVRGGESWQEVDAFICRDRPLSPKKKTPATQKFTHYTCLPQMGLPAQRLLVLRDFPTVAQAPPSPELDPSARQSRDLGAVRSGPRSRPLVVRPIGAEGRRAGCAEQAAAVHSRCARCPPCAQTARRAAAPHISEDGFAGADHPDGSTAPPRAQETGREVACPDLQLSILPCLSCWSTHNTMRR